METKEDAKQQTVPVKTNIPTSVNVLIWVIIGTIIFLVFWFVINPAIKKEQDRVKTATEKSCYSLQGLDYAPPKYKCLTNYPSSLICKTRDTTVNLQYSAFAYCMSQNGYKDY